MSGRDGMILCIGGPLDGKYVEDFGATMRSPDYSVRHIMSLRNTAEPETIVLSYVLYRKELLSVKDWEHPGNPLNWEGRDAVLYVEEGLTLFDAFLKVLSYYARDCQQRGPEEGVADAC